jgi:hypothetical protein
LSYSEAGLSNFRIQINVNSNHQNNRFPFSNVLEITNKNGRVKRIIMNARAIESLNLAVNVMRHFIELSAKLLPYYEQITRSENNSPVRQNVEKKIASVYEGYNVDPNSSLFLINSEIIGLIQEGYLSIKERKIHGEDQVQYFLEKFREEYDRLQTNWSTIGLN